MAKLTVARIEIGRDRDRHRGRDEYGTFLDNGRRFIIARRG